MMMSGLTTKSNTKPPPGTIVNWQVDPIWQGLVGAWFLNEGSGLRVHDSSGNNGNGILTNMDPSTDWVPARYGRGLDFDGSNDRVVVPSNLGITGYPFSMAAWVNFRATGVQQIVLSIGKSSVDNIYWAIGQHTSQWQIIARNTTFQSSLAGTVATGWHHVAGVFSSDTVKRLYVNGILLTTLTTSVAWNTTTNIFHLGSTALFIPDRHLNGIVDCAYIWNRELTVSEILSLMNHPFPDIRQRVWFVPSAVVVSRAGARFISLPGLGQQVSRPG